MKKILTILALCVLYSCTNEEVETTPDISEAASQVIQMKAGQKEAFRLLSPEQRTELWMFKLSEISMKGTYKNEKVILSDDQKLIVNELLALMKSNSLFSNAQNKTISSKFLTIENRIKLAFSKDERIFLFSSLDSPSEFSQKVNNKKSLNYRLLAAQTTNSEGSGDCGCNTSDDWCVTGNCEAASCDSTYQGCGFLWGKTCNGDCDG